MILPLRRWAYRITEHHRPLVFATSVAGMAGFVISTGPVRWWAPSEALALWGSLVSLGAYGVSLGIGYLGDPWELSRREQAMRGRSTEPRRARAFARTRRRSTALPTRSWT